MRFGIESPAYLKRYGISAGAEKMAKHGYDCVDYSYLAETRDAFFNLPEEAFRRELCEHAKILRSYGITPDQTHGPWRYPPRDRTPEDRAERFAAMSKSIRASAYLGAEHMVIHPLMPYGVETGEHADEVVQINLEFMSRLAEVGREWGVVVCYENMPFPRFPISTVSQILDIVRGVNSPYFKVCLDTGHALVCGEQPAESVRLIGSDLLATLHVHDNDGTRDSHRPIGEGIIDFPAFVDSLGEIGYRGVFSMETFADKENLLSGDARNSAEQSFLAHIKSYFRN